MNGLDILNTFVSVLIIIDNNLQFKKTVVIKRVLITNAKPSPLSVATDTTRLQPKFLVCPLT
jgi:hypothetical protein